MRLIISFLIVFSTLIAHTQTQVQMVPGQNLTEKKVQWIWSVLPVVVMACRVQNSCKMTESEKNILAKVILNISKYKRDSLVFKSEKEDPDFFNRDKNEAHRLAVTGNHPESKVYLNSDRISELNFSEIIALLGHEVIHHTGILDEEIRIPDQIGAKLRSYFENQSTTVNLEEYNHPEIQVYYFGVDIPDSMEYFKTFLKSQRARVALMDVENVYNIEKFNSDDESLCLYQPNLQFINQNISGSMIRVDRWFQGDKNVYLHFNVRTQNVCRNTLDSENADLKGFNLISQLSLQLNLLDPQLTHWQDSRLTINSNLIRTLARRPAPEEAGTQIQMARITEVVRKVESVQAGQRWYFEAKVSYSGDSLKAQCDASIKSEAWHSIDFIGLIPNAVYKSCKITKTGAGQYLVQVEIDILANSAPGAFQMDLLSLYTEKTETRIFASAATPILFQVQNSRTINPQIISAKFLTQNNVIKGDQITEFEVQIQNGTNINDPLITYQLIDELGDAMNFVANMRGENKNGPFEKPVYRMNGDILIATFKIRIPTKWGSIKFKSFRFMTLLITFENLHELYLDHRSNPEVYQIRGPE